eukprot:Gregarina_sp_Pseudo_9__1014@NODE_1656_length_1420_cov_374_650253_g1536_i0_p2_GENE_NODE_1656_length_1420_cov_374_650253_g1536_i0NODE_1656_length_1420_cov_374_650253_g1536_i0_p2_ORF_typecomplete_len201_score32_44PITH/PF06201_13/7_9e27_NODE_1656_length_1420_cov_374_650253_g1536_i074676
MHGEKCTCERAEEGGDWLLPAIEVPGVHCLNEETPASCQKLFRPHEERLTLPPPCASDIVDDEFPEILLKIPFSTPCDVTHLYLIGGGDTQPDTITVFANAEDLDFGSFSDRTNIQILNSVDDPCGNLGMPLKASKLKNVNSIQLLIRGRSNTDSVKVFYIGLKGRITNYQRKAVHTVYEAKPNLADHEVKQDYSAKWGA